MIPFKLPAIPLSEIQWRGLILTLSFGVLLLTIWCLTHGITIIFMHLYYFPIILLAYRYRWKGCGLAVLLALLYLGLVIVFDGSQADVVLGAFYRFLVFVGIAAVIAFITERLARAQETLGSLQQFQENVIANANIWISVLAPDGTLLVWNNAAEAISGYKKTDVVGRNTVWKQLYPDAGYRKKVTGEIRRILQQDTILEDFETDIRCADGSTKTIVWNTRSMRDAGKKVNGYVAIGRDITAQKAAELRAAESSRFIESMIDTLPIPVFFKDNRGRYLGCNTQFEEFIGIKRDQLIGKTVYDISPKDLADRYASADKELFDHPSPQRYETQVQYADGSRHDVIFDKAPFFNQDGSIAGLIGAYIDITDRKRAELALAESEKIYRAFFSTSRDCVFITRIDGTWVDFNDVTVELFGYGSREELQRTKSSQIYANPSDRETHIAFIIRKGYSFEYPVDLKKKDGTIIHTLITTVVRKDESGTVIGFQGSIRDITERRHAEEALRESENKYRTLFENMLEGFAYCRMIYDNEGRPVDWEYLDVNRSFGEITGLKVMAGKRVLEAIPDIRELTPELFDAYGRVASTGRAETFEIDFKPMKMWLKVSVFSPEKGYFVAVFENVTERKEAETALRESEEKYRLLFSHMTAGSALHEIVYDPASNPVDYRILDINPAFERILGLKREDIIGKNSREAYRSDTPPFLDTYARIVSSGKPEELEVYFAPMKKHFVISAYSPGAGKFATIFEDITERKLAEEEIRLSNLILTTQQETSPDGILIVEESGKILSFNRRFADLWGIPSDVIASRIDEHVLSFVLDKLINPEEFLARVRYLYDHREEKSREEIHLRDGSVFDRYSAPMLGENNRYFGRVWYFRDITERILAEQALRESEERYRTLAETSPDWIYIIGRDDTIRYINSTPLKIFHLSFDQVVGAPRKIIFPPDIADAQGIVVRKVFETGEHVQTEEKIQFGTQEFWLDTHSVPLKDKTGNVTAVLGIARDVTERKHTEEELHASRRLFMDIISFLPDPTLVIDNNGKVLAWNRALEHISGVPAREMIGKGDHEYSIWQYGKRRPILIDLVLHPDASMGGLNYLNITREEHTVTAQTEIILPGSARKATFFLVASPLMDSRGQITGAIESMRDITRLREAEAELANINQNLEKIVHDRTQELENEVRVRKQAEAAIKESLDEKLVLLREIHHRVKNNLQIIISLTNLQMRQMNDPQIRQIMAETQNRVRAMSLVHEKLYGSENLEKIDFADYTRFLATQLFAAYGTDTRKVRLDCSIGTLMLDINTAVPLGLIMNELLSNALKHAFPGGREGIISISGGEADNLIRLVVRDNGIGLPEGFDWKTTTTLGMRLVTGLIDQLDGTIGQDKTNGTAYTITIPREPAGGSRQ